MSSAKVYKNVLPPDFLMKFATVQRRVERFGAANFVSIMQFDCNNPHLVQPACVARSKNFTLRPFDINLQDIDLIDGELINDFSNCYSCDVGSCSGVGG